MKIPYSESHKTRTCKTRNKVNLQKLTFTYVVILCMCMFYYILTFFCHPAALLDGSYDCIIMSVCLFYTCQLSLFFFFGTCFVCADKFIEKHGRIHVLTMNNRRQFNNHLWLLQWKCWSESRSSWRSIQTYANEGHRGFMHGFICFCE